MTTISHVIVDPTTRFVLIIINHDRFVDLQCTREMMTRSYDDLCVTLSSGKSHCTRGGLSTFTCVRLHPGVGILLFRLF